MLPTDVIYTILSHRDIPCSTKVYFQQVFGTSLATKIQIPDGLQTKLNNVINNRKPIIINEIQTLLYKARLDAKGSTLSLTFNNGIDTMPCYRINIRKETCVQEYWGVYNDDGTLDFKCFVFPHSIVPYRFDDD